MCGEGWQGGLVGGCCSHAIYIYAGPIPVEDVGSMHSNGAKLHMYLLRM